MMSSVKLLGIVVSNDLNWGPHVEYMLAKVQPCIHYLRVAVLPYPRKCYCKSTSPLSDLCWSMVPPSGPVFSVVCQTRWKEFRSCASGFVEFPMDTCPLSSPGGGRHH
ncbi:hypothetical protein Bbelb_227650 [Branchiostoma belcheri]|nr:hypothetical protein Bbelb_227650 [Branchiostoma belcheri]